MPNFLARNDLNEPSLCEVVIPVTVRTNPDGTINLPPMPVNLSTYEIDAKEACKAYRGLEVLHEQLSGLSEETTVPSDIRQRMLRRLVRAMNAIRGLSPR